MKDIEEGKLGITACKKKYGIQSRSTRSELVKKKYGNFDWETKHQTICLKPEQRIMELGRSQKVLQKQKAF